MTGEAFPINICQARGPLINKVRVDAVLERIKGARAQGARALVEGELQGSQKNTIPPHLFVDVEQHYAMDRGPGRDSLG
jgi:acyl-CoA reductase-like NAD-dependent aldehyde dehydrogenase